MTNSAKIKFFTLIYEEPINHSTNCERNELNFTIPYIVFMQQNYTAICVFCFTNQIFPVIYFKFEIIMNPEPWTLTQEIFLHETSKVGNSGI